MECYTLVKKRVNLCGNKSSGFFNYILKLYELVFTYNRFREKLLVFV